MPSGAQSAPGLKSFGFGMVALKKFPELIPLAAIISGACVMCGSFMAYAILTKPDVQVNRTTGVPCFERIEPTQKQKLLTFNQKYAPIPELEALRKEIGSYKS